MNWNLGDLILTAATIGGIVLLVLFGTGHILN